MKKILPIMIALLLAAFASWGIMEWARKQQTSNQTVPYVSAAKLLPPGTILRHEDLSTGFLPYPVYGPEDSEIWTAVFNDFVRPENVNQIVGRELAYEVQEGRPVLNRNLKRVSIKKEGVDWKVKIPEGQRAIAIPITGTNAVNGLVQVGDHVDVLVTVEVPRKEEGQQSTVNVPLRMGDAMQTMTVPTGDRRKGEPMTFYLLQDVEVLSVGDKTFMDEEIDMSDPLAAMAARAEQGGGGITVALPPDKILTLAFVMSGGNAIFTVVLRQPNDVSLYDTTNKPPADFKGLMQMINAPAQ